MQNPFNSSEAAKQQANNDIGNFGGGVKKPSVKTLTYKSAKTAKDGARVADMVKVMQAKAGLYFYRRLENEQTGENIKVDPFPFILLKTLINIRGTVKNGNTFTNYASTYMENSKSEVFALYKQGAQGEKPIFKGSYEDFKLKKSSLGLDGVKYTQMHFVLNIETNEIIEIESSSIFNTAIEVAATNFLGKKASSMFLAPPKSDGTYLGFFTNGSFQGITEKGEPYFSKNEKGEISYADGDLYFMPKFEVGVADVLKDKAVAAREQIDAWINSKKKPTNIQETAEATFVANNFFEPYKEETTVAVLQSPVPHGVVVEDDLPF